MKIWNIFRELEMPSLRDPPPTLDGYDRKVRDVLNELSIRLAFLDIIIRAYSFIITLYWTLRWRFGSWFVWFGWRHCRRPQRTPLQSQVLNTSPIQVTECEEKDFSCKKTWFDLLDPPCWQYVSSLRFVFFHSACLKLVCTPKKCVIANRCLGAVMGLVRCKHRKTRNRFKLTKLYRFTRVRKVPSGMNTNQWAQLWSRFRAQPCIPPFLASPSVGLVSGTACSASFRGLDGIKKVEKLLCIKEFTICALSVEIVIQTKFSRLMFLPSTFYL